MTQLICHVNFTHKSCWAQGHLRRKFFWNPVFGLESGLDTQRHWSHVTFLRFIYGVTSFGPWPYPALVGVLQIREQIIVLIFRIWAKTNVKSFFLRCWPLFTLDHLNDIENRRHREIVHFRQKWTPNSLDQLKSTRKFLIPINIRSNVLATIYREMLFRKQCYFLKIYYVSHKNLFKLTPEK